MCSNSVLVLSGLPGSGKTTLARRLVATRSQTCSGTVGWVEFVVPHPKNLRVQLDFQLHMVRQGLKRYMN